MSGRSREQAGPVGPVPGGSGPAGLDGVFDGAAAQNRPRSGGYSQNPSGPGQFGHDEQGRPDGTGRIQDGQTMSSGQDQNQPRPGQFGQDDESRRQSAGDQAYDQARPPQYGPGANQTPYGQDGFGGPPQYGAPGQYQPPGAYPGQSSWSPPQPPYGAPGQYPPPGQPGQYGQPPQYGAPGQYGPDQQHPSGGYASGPYDPNQPGPPYGPGPGAPSGQWAPGPPPGGGYNQWQGGPPPYNNSLLRTQLTPKEANQWAAAAHLGGMLAWIPVLPLLPAIVIYNLQKDNNQYVREQSLEAVNFQICVLGLWIVAWIINAMPLLPGDFTTLVWCFSGIFALVAGISAFKGDHFRYPLTRRFLD